MTAPSRMLGLGVFFQLLLLHSPSVAVVYTSDFSTGLDPVYWQVVSNQPAYVVDDTQGDVRIAKPFADNTTLQVARIRFLYAIVGDFDASVDFRDASINRTLGQPGNQVQLNITVDGQEFDVVRSDEILIGHNCHVWVDPTQQLEGTRAESALAGTLRITRTGTIITGYFNGTPIFGGSYSTAPVASLSFSLQNNGTKDPTSVTFDNFSLSADDIVPQSVTAAGGDDRVPAWGTLGITPNPFSSSTRIDYGIETEGQLSLEVFDVTGHRVATLYEGHRARGSYIADWNAEDSHGVRVPSGVYFARLVFQGQAVTRRMVLLH